jgi:transposase
MKMTVYPQNACSIATETARLAHAAYPEGNFSLKMRDAFGTIYQDESPASLFPHNERLVEAQW